MMGYFRMGKAEIVGAFDGENLIGYAQFFQKENGRTHLNQIAVREGWQGKGVGTLLLGAVEKGARERASNMVELFCNEGNDVAKNFYRKHRFATEKLLMVRVI